MEVEDVNNCDTDDKPITDSGTLSEDKDFIQSFIRILSIDDCVSAYEQFIQYHSKYGEDIITRNCNLFNIGFESSNSILNAEFVYNGDDTEYSCTHHVTPFLYAVIRNNTDIVRHLIANNGALIEGECCLDIESDNYLVHGLCALTIAVSLNYHNMAELLLSAGAKVDHPTESLSTGLRIACHANDIDMIRLLISYGADPNFKNVFEHTPLMLSSFLGHEEAIMLLVKHGADVNQQAKCGATALHFAAQEGRHTLIRDLLHFGAELKKDDSGHTPLMVGALNSHVLVVHEFLKIPRLTTFEEKVTALELLGASFVTTFSERFDTDSVHFYLRCAFRLRYTGMNKQVCGCTCCSIQDDPVEEERKKLPDFPKTRLEPMVTYEYHQESQTFEQLESIKFNDKKTFLECLVILERILGPKSLHLSDILKRCGAVLADSLESVAASRLWLRALRIKIDARIFIGLDFYHFTKLIEKMSRYRQSYTEYLKQGLELALDYFQARPRPFGYQELLFPKPAEEFTFNNHKHINPSLSSKKDGNYLDPKQDSDILILMILYLISHVANKFKNYSEEDQAAFRRLTYRLCQTNITESRTGRTLLHLAFSMDNYIKILNTNKLYQFPNVKLATFLVSCGADVTAIDMLHNTPLHYLALFCMRDTSVRFEDNINLISAMVKSRVSRLNFVSHPNGNNINPRKLPLFYGGEVQAHLDAVNVFGKTPFQVNSNVLTSILMNPFNTVPKLKCLAARVVHEKYFKEVAFEFTLLDYSTEASCENFISYVEGLLPTDFIGYNSSARTFIHNFEQIDINMQNVEELLRLMHHYSKKLKLSLELVQFVEMHGPCKFAHI